MSDATSRHHPNHDLVVVLNDGETYTNIQGCTVQFVPEEMDAEDVERAIRSGELESEIVLCASDVVEAARDVLETEQGPDAARALAELCNALRLREDSEIAETAAELGVVL